MISQPNDKIIASSKERIGSGDGSDILSDILKILEDLETSLQASQDALLVHDVARLEDLTHQQLSLRCRILAYLEERSAIGREGAVRRGALLVSGLQTSQQVRSAAIRVLRLGQLQRVLLERMQQLLRVAENRAVGLQAGYSPSPSQRVIRPERNPRASAEA
jgi:hypothetical protein